jgi:AcrR family transcriptional regulator
VTAQPSAPVRRRRDRTARREELLAAADRVVRRLGPDASMDAIAAEAGITKPILYRFFGDKRELHAALAERYMEELYRESNEVMVTRTRPHRRIADGIDAFLRAVEREPQMFRFVRYVQEDGTAGSAGDVLRRHVAYIADATRRDFERFGLDSTAADAVAHGLVGMMQFTASWWLENRDVPRERLVAQLTDWLWEGFRHLDSAASWRTQ